MKGENDQFEKEYFRDYNNECRRQQKEEKERKEREREEKERIERLVEIRQRGREKSLRTTKNIYPGYPYTIDVDEVSDEKFNLICNINEEPSTPNQYARKHGFLNRHDIDCFNEETKDMCFFQKMNYLIENADEFGLTESTYYLNGVSSNDYSDFAEAIVEACLIETPEKTYAELKEELETIHNKMIMDIGTINEIVSQGKSRQWNTRIHHSIDGVEFCVFNQLRYENQILRAIAFAICHRKWNLYVDAPYDESDISDDASFTSGHLNDSENIEC